MSVLVLAEVIEDRATLCISGVYVVKDAEEVSKSFKSVRRLGFHKRENAVKEAIPTIVVFLLDVATCNFEFLQDPWSISIGPFTSTQPKTQAVSTKVLEIEKIYSFDQY